MGVEGDTAEEDRSVKRLFVSVVVDAEGAFQQVVSVHAALSCNLKAASLPDAMPPLHSLVAA